jgi:hypothetical protein
MNNFWLSIATAVIVGALVAVAVSSGLTRRSHEARFSGYCHLADGVPIVTLRGHLACLPRAVFSRVEEAR